jgi:8-amino-7-oxononanoate synthase
VADSRLSARFSELAGLVSSYKEIGNYPYFRVIEKSYGTEVEVRGRRLLMTSSNDYLGFTHDPEIIEKSIAITRKFGTGTGGSRLLCGNFVLHHELQERLARFVGKKTALVFPTGFTTNLGAVVSLLKREDTILFDRENHASIYDACLASRAKILPFRHNDPEDAAAKLSRARISPETGIILLITEGVFSMSGTIVDLPRFIELKKQHPHFHIYLDDAHGLGTIGEGGRGVAGNFNAQQDVDFIMGTFSKTFASIGGFFATDDQHIADHMLHSSRTMLFSASLPPGNIATVLACLDILENDTGRTEQLWKNIDRIKQGFQAIGIGTDNTRSPILPIHIGEEDTAMRVSHDLFEQNIFALPVLYPAVPRKKAIIRSTFMSTHTDAQIDFYLEVLEKFLRRHDLIGR